MSKKKQDLANQLLDQIPLDFEDAARLILELLETTGEIEQTDRLEAMAHCRHIIQKGALTYAREKRTLPFYRVVEEHLRGKAHRRSRTIGEVGQYFKRIMIECPHWCNHPLSNFTTKDCQEAIEKTFKTNCMQRKAFNLLRGLFTFGQRRGLCSENPVNGVNVPPAEEKRIQVLNIPEIRRILETAQKPEHITCAGAVGIMLWAGIRPNEIERLRWEQIKLKERIIEVEPRHAKTGGARQVTIHPVLARWLRKVCPFTPASASVTPKAWARRWRSLRQDAGFHNWQADTLRHSFASYHLKHFKNIEALRLEMGHRGTELLRTRYLSMGGMTEQAAKQFWGITPRSS